MTNQTVGFENIVVVDDGSPVPAKDIASEFGAKYVLHETNLGQDQARNSGFRHCTNSLVASVDADCVLSESWLETLLPHFEKNDIAIVSGRLIETKTEKIADKWRCLHMKQDWGLTMVNDPDRIFGNNAIIRRNVLFEVGLYESKYRTNGEDMYISQKVKERRLRTVYDPRALAYHLRCDDLRSVSTSFWRWKSCDDDLSRLTNRIKSAAQDVFYAFRFLRSDLRARNYWAVKLLPLFLVNWWALSLGADNKWKKLTEFLFESFDPESRDKSKFE